MFVLLAFAISWAMHIPLAIATLRSGDPAAQAGSILNFLAPWGPAIAAITVTAIVMGARGPHRLLRKLKVWRVGLHWYLIAVLLPAAMWLITRAVDAVLGRTYQLDSLLADPNYAPLVPALLISAFIYTLGEELGWRAYALPRLQEGSTALAAGLIVGLLWGLWHVPTWVAQGYSGTDLVPPVVSVIAGSLLFAWIYNGSGGSLLLVWIFHTASTMTGYVLPELPTPTDDLVRLAVVLGVVVIAGPTDLSRSRPRQRLTALPVAGLGGVEVASLLPTVATSYETP